MFYIVNCSGRHVSLSSLGIMLAPRQGIDLDQKFTRMQSEKSADLKNAISKGIIKLVRKDGGGSNQISPSKDKKDIEVLMQIKKMLEENKSKDIDALADAVAARIGSIKTVAESPVINKDKSGVLENEMDSSMLEVIHRKAVDRMTKNVEGQTPSEHVSKVDININTNLDELEGLL
jgi:hypothetical protein